MEPSSRASPPVTGVRKRVSITSVLDWDTVRPRLANLASVTRYQMVVGVPYGADIAPVASIVRGMNAARLQSAMAHSASSYKLSRTGK